jgi:hypothetical protein
MIVTGSDEEPVQIAANQFVPATGELDQLG